MFDTAKDILGYDLLDVCVNGPAERLNSTEVSQPAIYVSSMAALEKMKSTAEGQADIDAVDVCAGQTLGEYTALTFAEEGLPGRDHCGSMGKPALPPPRAGRRH